MSRMLIDASAAEFARYRQMAEKAAAQVSWDRLREAMNPDVNSVAVIMKHVAGNLMSRWTDVLTSDGEKSWRDRDSEFRDDFADRAAMEGRWREGWAVLDGALASLSDADLSRSVRIRGEPMTLASALARSLAHVAYHCGQIVQDCRVHASRDGVEWKTLTIARGKSGEFNRGMGYGTETRGSAGHA